MDFFEKNIYLKKLDRNITVRMLGQREMAQVLRERDKVTQAMGIKNGSPLLMKRIIFVR